MPRIAGSLAVVATIAFCIGFNVNRYPAVWEMVNAAQGGLPAGKAAASLASAKPAAAQTPPSRSAEKPPSAHDDAAHKGKDKDSKDSEKDNASHKILLAAQTETVSAEKPTTTSGPARSWDSGKASEPKTSEHKKEPLKPPAEEKTPDRNDRADRADEQDHPAKPRWTDTADTTLKPAESKPADSKPAESKPADSKRSKGAGQKSTAKSSRPSEQPETSHSVDPASTAASDDYSSREAVDFKSGTDFETRTLAGTGGSNPKKDSAKHDSSPARLAGASAGQGRLVPVTPEPVGDSRSSLSANPGSRDRFGPLASAVPLGSSADRAVRRLPAVDSKSQQNPNLAGPWDKIPSYPHTAAK